MGRRFCKKQIEKIKNKKTPVEGELLWVGRGGGTGFLWKFYEDGLREKEGAVRTSKLGAKEETVYGPNNSYVHRVQVGKQKGGGTSGRGGKLVREGEGVLRVKEGPGPLKIKTEVENQKGPLEKGSPLGGGVSGKKRPTQNFLTKTQQKRGPRGGIRNSAKKKEQHIPLNKGKGKGEEKKPQGDTSDARTGKKSASR